MNKILTSAQSLLKDPAAAGCRLADLVDKLLEANAKTPAMEFIGFLVETGLASDGGERYRDDLCGRDGLGQPKFPEGTELTAVTLEEFLNRNPEMSDDLSGILDGTKTATEKRDAFLRALELAPSKKRERSPEPTME